MNTPRGLALAFTILFLCFPPAVRAASDVLATFTCTEYIDHDWARTLVTYPVTFKRGQARPGQVHLLDEQGREQPCQCWEARTHNDGSLASVRLSFQAELPKGGRYQYRLVRGALAATARPVRTITEGGYLTLDNGVVALRLPPPGEFTFKTPLRFGNGHAAMIRLYGRQEAHGIIPGPLQGVRLLNGEWVGGSYFYAARPEEAPKALGYTCRIIEHGLLFTDVRLSYRFEGNRYYRMTVRMLPGDPAVRIDEQCDFRRVEYSGGAAESALGAWQLVVSLTRGWEPGGWKPDYAFWGRYAYGSQLQPQQTDIEPRLQELGFTFDSASYGTHRLAYEQPQTLLFGLEPWTQFGNVAYYTGLVEKATLADRAKTPFLAVMPIHAGNWRGDGPRCNKLLYAHQGDAAMHWPLGIPQHPNTYTHPGEYDPELPYTFLRRQWALFGGAIQTPEALDAFRLQQGYINLDDYKDWILDWPEDPKATYPRLYMSKQDVDRLAPTLTEHPEGDLLKKYLYFTDNQQRVEQLWKQMLSDSYWSSPTGMMKADLKHWYILWRQAHATEGWVPAAEELLASPSLSAERRRLLRRRIAAFCYLQSEPDCLPRGSMVTLGTVNMAIVRFMALPFAALLIPDHPRYGDWMTTSSQFVHYKLAGNVAPGGGWVELFSYYDASAPTLLHAAVLLDRAGYLRKEGLPVAVQLAQFPLRFLSPRDPRFGMRMSPCWGHEGYNAFGQWLPTALLTRGRDEQMVDDMLWGWRQCGRLGGWHDTNLNLLAAWCADRLSALPADYLPDALQSAWVPGVGAVLRAHTGDPNETYLAYRQGYLISHCDDNQGDFILHAKGAPLVDMSLFAYPLHQHAPSIKMNLDFGWYSIPRFGSLDNVSDVRQGANKSPQAGSWNPSSAVHAHSFSPSTDYLRGASDNEGRRWTRQILFLKGKAAAGPNYFLFRDSADSLTGDPAALVQQWWTLRTRGSKAQVAATGTGLQYTSAYGPQLQVRFLQPAQVASETREVSRTQWSLKSFDQLFPDGKAHLLGNQAARIEVDATLAVTSFGPIAADRDILVALYPQANGEAPPAYEPLADGAAKITTGESTDYVFLNRRPFTLRRGNVAFSGRAGAVRVYPDEVHLVIAEGPGAVTYRGVTLRSPVPALRVIPVAKAERTQVIDIPPEKPIISFALNPRRGKIETIGPGVRRQVLRHGTAYAFDSPESISFAQDGATFTGRRGGIVVDDRARSVRVVMLDGERIGAASALAWGADGAYDITFFPDRITGQTAGQGRFVNVLQPAGIDRLASLEIDGLAYAPGTSRRFDAGQRLQSAEPSTVATTLVLPILPGEHRFTVRNLRQPPVWRNWQHWTAAGGRDKR